jgi:hypothetical protein
MYINRVLFYSLAIYPLMEQIRLYETRLFSLRVSPFTRSTMKICIAITRARSSARFSRSTSRSPFLARGLQVDGCPRVHGAYCGGSQNLRAPSRELVTVYEAPGSTRE